MRTKHIIKPQPLSKFTINLVIIASILAIFSIISLGLPGVSISEKASADTANSDVSLGVNSSISISTYVNNVSSNNVVINITPSNDGSLATTQYPIQVRVATNNQTGYTLTMSSSTDNTALTHTAGSTTGAVPTLDSSTTYSAWSDDTNLNNRWGYTHNNTGDVADASTGVILANSYLPISPYSTPAVLKVTNAPASASNTDVTFAAKIDTSKPSGTYTNTVTFTAVTNPEPTPTTMQEFTASDCANLETWTSSNNAEIELADSRGMVTGLDYSTYTIRKLADGNCWMIDNLRLPGGTTVTSSNSDVTSDYTLPSSSTSGFDSDDGQFMYDNPNNTNGYDSSYYSWLVAVAKTSSPSSTQYYNVPTSICPKGWHLPSAYGASSQAGQSSSSVNGQFTNLYTAYSSTVSTFNTAFNSVFAGIYSYSSFYDGGSYGLWWSSTVFSSTVAYLLYASSSNVNPTDYDNRGVGYSIRCVLGSS